MPPHSARNGFARRRMRLQRLFHGVVGLQAFEMQFGIATGKIKTIHVGQRGVGQRREKSQLRAHGAQQVEILPVEKRERRVARDADAHAREQRRRRRQCNRLEADRLGQRREAGFGDGLGAGLKTFFQIGDFLRLH